jgi:IBR domain, a half RING-finger domain
MALISSLAKPFRRSKAKKKPKPSPTKENECLVCLETEECITTSSCGHAICLTCLGRYIEVTHHSRMPCPCPSSAICKAAFTIDDITPFVDNAVIGKIWLAQAAIRIEAGNGMYCPNIKCSKPILWNQQMNKKRGMGGKCRGCQTSICIYCKTAYHSGLTYPAS